MHQPGAETGATDVGAQDVVRERQQLGAPVGDVDDQRAAEVAAGAIAPVRRGSPRAGVAVRGSRDRALALDDDQPPASADRNATASPLTRGASGSRVIA